MQLKIPDGINYECTGCGKCCSGWSVPLTQEDFDRISAIDWASLNPDFKGKDLFRELHAHEKSNTPYSHAIRPENNGHCPFLKDNLCFIHKEFGATTKPAICQLFPYSFNETPGGVFATVSFISRGAILNSGRALSDQEQLLTLKYKEFQKLFPDHHPNWSAIKLSSNVPIDWTEYSEIEKELLKIIKEPSKGLEERFIEGAFFLQSVLSKKLANGSVNNQADQVAKAFEVNDLPTAPELSLNQADRSLINTLYRKYFSMQNGRVKGYGQLSLDLTSFIAGFLRSGQNASLIKGQQEIRCAEFDEQVKDLINRFFYSRIFCKLYFAAGFGQLSLIAGFNHLGWTLALLKMRLCERSQLSNNKKINLDDAIAVIVELEKSLGELKISPYGAAILELLLSSKRRIRRILA